MGTTTSTPARLAAYFGDLVALAGLAVLATDLSSVGSSLWYPRIAVDLSLIAAGLGAHRVATSAQRDVAALALALLIAGAAPSVLVLQRWWIALAAGAAAAAVAPHAVPPRRAAVWIVAGTLLGLAGVLNSWPVAGAGATFVLLLGLVSQRLADDLRGRGARQTQQRERAMTEERLRSAELFVRLAQYEGRSAGHRASGLRAALSRRLGTIGAIATSLARELRGTPAGVAKETIERAERLAELAGGGESREQQTTLSLIWPHVAESLTGRLLPVHHLEVAIPETVPPVVGTAQEWQHILTAAVENALDAVPGGGVVRVRAGPSDPPGYVGVVVEDNGPGTRDDLLGRARRHGKELSLGTAAALVEVLGGSVDVEFVEGRGTRLTIAAPRYERPALARASTSVETGPVRLDGTVLLADDDKDARGALARLLESFGLTVVQADTGTMALAEFTAAPDRYTAAILDVVMEGTPVGDVVAGIRDRRPRFPVVLISGYDTHRYVDSVLALGGVRFLRKPIQRDDLFATFRDLATVEP